MAENNDWLPALIANPETFVESLIVESLALAAKRANEELITGILLRQAERDVDEGKLSEEIN